jgi:hypothetical protein
MVCHPRSTAPRDEVGAHNWSAGFPWEGAIIAHRDLDMALRMSRAVPRQRGRAPQFEPAMSLFRQKF